MVVVVVIVIMRWSGVEDVRVVTLALEICILVWSLVGHQLAIVISSVQVQVAIGLFLLDFAFLFDFLCRFCCRFSGRARHRDDDTGLRLEVERWSGFGRQLDRLSDRRTEGLHIETGRMYGGHDVVTVDDGRLVVRDHVRHGRQVEAARLRNGPPNVVQEEIRQLASCKFDCCC